MNWKKCIYSNNYKISDTGEIYSFNINRNLKPSVDKDGYLIVTLQNNYKVKRVSVHRLVATHFLNNEENLPQVNHKDGNKKNNDVSNLEWVTCKENIRHMHETGLGFDRKGQKHPLAKLTEEQVKEIKILLTKGLTNLEIGRKFNISHQQISRIKLGKRWNHL